MAAEGPVVKCQAGAATGCLGKGIGRADILQDLIDVSIAVVAQEHTDIAGDGAGCRLRGLAAQGMLDTGSDHLGDTQARGLFDQDQEPVGFEAGEGVGGAHAGLQ